MLSFLGITTVSYLDVSPGRRFCLHFTYIACVCLAYPLHTCIFSNRHHPGVISMIVALPDFLVVVPCSLSVIEFDVCAPPMSKLYEIWNQKTKMVLLFTTPQVEASEAGVESRRKVVEGKWKCQYFFLRWLQMPFPGVIQGLCVLSVKHAIGMLSHGQMLEDGQCAKMTPEFSIWLLENFQLWQ